MACLKFHDMWIVSNDLCTYDIFRYSGPLWTITNIVLYESDEKFAEIWLFNKNTLKKEKKWTQCGITFEDVQ